MEKLYVFLSAARRCQFIESNIFPFDDTVSHLIIFDADYWRNCYFDAFYLHDFVAVATYVSFWTWHFTSKQNAIHTHTHAHEHILTSETLIRSLDEKFVKSRPDVVSEWNWKTKTNRYGHDSGATVTESLPEIWGPILHDGCWRSIHFTTFHRNPVNSKLTWTHITFPAYQNWFDKYLFCILFSYKYAAPKTPENEMELLNTFEHRMTLEDHYEEMKTMDIDTWDQVRSRRPWDEPPDHPQAAETDAKKSEAKTWITWTICA